MSYNGSDILRISAEYERRAREIPQDYYSWGKPSNLLLNGRKVADIVGTWVLEFAQRGADPADLGGIDLKPERLACVRRRIPEADLYLGSTSELPWPGDSFDLVSQLSPANQKGWPAPSYQRRLRCKKRCYLSGARRTRGSEKREKLEKLQMSLRDIVLCDTLVLKARMLMERRVGLTVISPVITSIAPKAALAGTTAAL